MAYSNKVNELVAAGSKAYSEKDYDTASDKYGDACAEFHEESGKDDPDLLYLYGKALYQAAVASAGVFGGEVNNAANEEEDNQAEGNDDNDGAFQLEAPMADGEEVPDAPAAEEEDGDKDEDKKEEQGEEQSDNNDNDTQIASGGNSLFEEAWDVLELARALWQDQYDEHPDNKEVLEKLAEVYDLLGEVGLEVENFEQLASDLKQSLALRQKICGDDTSNKLLVESNYKIALSEEYCGNRELAIKYLNTAIDLLTKQDADGDDAKADKEALLLDLRDKLEEIKRDQTDTEAEQMAQLKGLIGSAFGATPEGLLSATTKPAPAAVNDLTSMVKKRKAPKDDKSAKRSKPISK